MHPNKGSAMGTIAEGVEGTIINTSYSSIGYKMLKSMKALKYKTQQQQANAPPASSALHQTKDDVEPNEDGSDPEPESQFLIGHTKTKKTDDDPKLYYVLSCSICL